MATSKTQIGDESAEEELRKELLPSGGGQVRHVISGGDSGTWAVVEYDLCMGSPDVRHLRESDDWELDSAHPMEDGVAAHINKVNDDT